MKISYSWLREVLTGGAQPPTSDTGGAQPPTSDTGGAQPPTSDTGGAAWEVDAQELEQALIRIGHEVEEVITLGPVTGPLTIGRVSTIEELTDFKKPIRACTVDVGDSALRDIVCGATNFAVGDMVVVALPGTTLPGGFHIASRKTYGRLSDGMICSAAELGLASAGLDLGGILVLPPGTAEPGDDAAGVLGLDDVIFNLAITPDRGYCLSMRGIARDIACAFNLKYRDPADIAPLPVEGLSVPVVIKPGTGVKRCAVRSVNSIDPHAQTPWWLQRRLMLSGVRPISPAVDVTNYVMMELGHPLHAHDRAKVRGGLAVRFAEPAETVRTLDGVQRKLIASDVVIADDQAVAAIGGVMGAGTTEISDESRDVLIEAAVWDPAAVSRTARRLHVVSEAARRYERAVDPAISVAALDRCVMLLADITGGVVEPKLTDWRGDPPCEQWSPQPIRMAIDLPDRIAGVRYPSGTTVSRLTQIGAQVSTEPDGVTVVVIPPSWRPDIQQPADLVEEVLRCEGLATIPSVLPTAPAGAGLTQRQRRRRAVGSALAQSGYVEVLPHPFLSAEVFDQWGLTPDDPRRHAVAVLNPLEADRCYLATTLLPSLLEALSRNVSRGFADIGLFSVAQVVQPGEQWHAVEPISTDRRPTEDEIAQLNASLPHQPVHIGMVLTGLREPKGHWGSGRSVEAADAFDAVRVIARACGVDVSFRSAQQLPWHPGRCAQVMIAECVIGYAGQLHPAMIERCGLPPGTCAVELDLDAVPFTTELPAPRISPFPAVFQDVSVVVAADVPAQAVIDALWAGGGDVVEDVALFDVYTGSQIGEGCKSLTLALRFRAADRTLTEQEATAARIKAVAVATERVGAVQRT